MFDKADKALVDAKREAETLAGDAEKALADVKAEAETIRKSAQAEVALADPRRRPSRGDGLFAYAVEVNDLIGWTNQYGGLLGLGIGLVGILVTIVIARHSRDRKALGFEVLNNLALLSRGLPRGHELKVQYGSAEVKDPRIVTVRVSNVGNRPIVASDYDEGLLISNIETGHILSASHVGPESEKLAGPLVIDGNTAKSVSLQPRLLNANESFDVQLVCDGPVSIKASSRIVGQTAPIRQVDSAPKALDRFPSIVASGGLLLVAAGIILSGVSGWSTGVLVALLMASVALSIVSAGLATYQFKRIASTFASRGD